MGAPTVDRIDAGFERVRAVRFLQRRRAECEDPDFWRALNPVFHISPMPFADVPPLPAAPALVADWGRRLIHEGYFDTGPLVPEPRLRAFRGAMDALVAAGIPSGFACVYDEYYQLFQGFEPVFDPLLGEGYRWVAHGFWAFWVPPGDPGLSGMGAASPHRDSLGPDEAVLARRLPSIVTVWLALTDVTPVHSCIYVVPADGDPDYFTAERDVRMDRLRLQAIRAVPARAGSLLAWSTHLAHWGSRASRQAAGPRMSATMYFQRADAPPSDASIFDAGGPVPFRDRLRWIAQSMGCPGFFD